ncbi:unnamed protein product [Discosporangium mesarthrocarpum]
MFSGSAVAWFCRTLQVVALFSTEAEFMAMGEFVKELPFFKNVLRFVQPLSGVEDNTIWVYEDNMGAINLAENPSSSGRSKHIDLWHHFLRQLVQDRATEIRNTCQCRGVFHVIMFLP